MSTILYLLAKREDYNWYLNLLIVYSSGSHPQPLVILVGLLTELYIPSAPSVNENVIDILRPHFSEYDPNSAGAMLQC